ncbi:unnamed protein product, partial [Sphacelaria rigidula]
KGHFVGGDQHFTSRSNEGRSIEGKMGIYREVHEDGADDNELPGKYSSGGKGSRELSLAGTSDRRDRNAGESSPTSSSNADKAMRQSDDAKISRTENAHLVKTKETANAVKTTSRKPPPTSPDLPDPS